MARGPMASPDAEVSARIPLVLERLMTPDFDPELAEMFAEAVPERIEQIEAAVQQGDLAELGRLGHQLKGAAAGYGFPKITEAAAVVETMARGESPDDAAVILATRELLRLLGQAAEYRAGSEAA
ncbi:MAG: Hpt domain-containing protein [Planctomycetota bacterium]